MDTIAKSSLPADIIGNEMLMRVVYQNENRIDMHKEHEHVATAAGLFVLEGLE